jgi:hypothetical protein
MTAFVATNSAACRASACRTAGGAGRLSSAWAREKQMLDNATPAIAAQDQSRKGFMNANLPEADAVSTPHCFGGLALFPEAKNLG